MKSPEEMLGKALNNISKFADFSDSTGLRSEIEESIKVYNGGSNGQGQWLAEDWNKQKDDGMPTITLNRIASGIDAISGFEIQNRTKLNFIPRIYDDPEQVAKNDILGDIYRYIEKDAKIPQINSQAFKDMLITGYGVTDSSISYDKVPDGEVEHWNESPLFLLYDTSARDMNMSDSDWRAVARVRNKEAFNEEWGEDSGIKITESEEASPTSRDDYWLRLYENVNNQEDLVVQYHYQCRVLEPIFRLNNPFKDHIENNLVMNYAGELEVSYGIELNADVLTLTQEQWKDVKIGLEALGIEYEKPTKQNKYKYYRLIIGEGRLLHYDENYSQDNFSIQVMTGNYDHINRRYYGLVRAAKHSQRMLNAAISDYKGYLETIPKGGVMVEEGAVSDPEKFVKFYAKARDVTFVKDGAIANSRILPKQPAPPPPGLLDFWGMSSEAVLQSMGITSEFLGMLTSKDMTGVLQQQITRQVLSVLASYFDAKQFFMLDLGKLMIDCVRILIENNGGRYFGVVTEQGNVEFKQLFENKIASEYDVHIGEAPHTPFEREERFNQILMLSREFAATGRDILPLALKYSSLDKEDIVKAEQMIQPPPPPQPDPVQQGLLESQSNLNNAQAQKLQADADKTQIEMGEVLEEIKKLQAQTQELYSQAQLNQAKANEVMQQPIQQPLIGGNNGY